MNGFRVEPVLHPRVWGGRRLGSGGSVAIGEAWLAGPTTQVSAAGFTGTLDELAREVGPGLVGIDAPDPRRFPLLVKVLDAAEWLSVQVHPDDRTARTLHGPAAIGKTEAWYVLEADAGAALRLGPRSGASDEAVRRAIAAGDGSIVPLLTVEPARAGQTFLVPAGTLHAVGPGLLLYEIQQPSDLTYRVWDWGRPGGPERPLHLREALAALTAQTAGDGNGADTQPVDLGGGPPQAWRAVLVRSGQFTLERLQLQRGSRVRLDPATRSVHVLTAIEGSPVVSGVGWRAALEPFATTIIPADGGPYEVLASGDRAASLLLAHLPEASPPS